MYSAPSKSQKRKLILTDAHRRMYALEREENFRWIFKLLASRFPYPLTHSAMADTSLQSELASIGQFAEVAHGSVQPEFIWQNLEALIRESYPLEGYTALSGSRLLDVWTGDVAKLQAYVAYRPSQRQLVVAFSGTTNLNQVLLELNVRLVPHPHLQHEYAGKAKVHAGFWKIYSGLRTRTLESLKKAALGLEGVVDEVVVTGHSLGGVMSSLFVLDLLAVQESGHWLWHSPHSMKIKLMTFGAPRLGNRIFAQAYRAVATDHRLRHGEDCLKDYAVRGFNDGVPCLPLKCFGYAHLHHAVLYLFNGRLYHVPELGLEYMLFDVAENEDRDSQFPLGGHNYYNNRDMEKCLRRLRWANIAIPGDSGWEGPYLQRLGEEVKKRT